MPIKKIPTGYEVRYNTYDASGDRHQRRKRFDKAKDAREFDAKHTIDNKEESNITVKEYLDGWLEHVRVRQIERRKKPLTYISYRQQVNLLYAAFSANIEKWRINPAKLKMIRLRKSQMQAVVDWLISEGYGEGTINTFCTVLSTAFNSAVNGEDEIINRNPMRSVERGGQPISEFKPYDAEQAQALIDAARGTDFFMQMFLALSMGLCAGEVGGLKWKDVDFKAGTLAVNQIREYGGKEFGIYEGSPKTKKRRRTLLMPQFVAQELKDEKKRQLENQVLMGEKYHRSDFVCRKAEGGLYVPQTYADASHRIMKKAGLHEIPFHYLRHSYASVSRAHGVPIDVISKNLGHSNVRITEDVYVYIFAQAGQEAADTMDRIYNKCGKSVADTENNAHK
jgi:integrase